MYVVQEYAHSLESCLNQEVQKLKYKREEEVTFNICA